MTHLAFGLLLVLLVSWPFPFMQTGSLVQLGQIERKTLVSAAGSCNESAYRLPLRFHVSNSSFEYVLEICQENEAAQKDFVPLFLLVFGNLLFQNLHQVFFYGSHVIEHSNVDLMINALWYGTVSMGFKFFISVRSMT